MDHTAFLDNLRTEIDGYRDALRVAEAHGVITWGAVHALVDRVLLWDALVHAEGGTKSMGKPRWWLVEPSIIAIHPN